MLRENRELRSQFTSVAPRAKTTSAITNLDGNLFDFGEEDDKIKFPKVDNLDRIRDM